MINPEDEVFPSGPEVFTKLVTIDDDDEEEDNCLRISEIKGEPKLGTACIMWESSLILAKYFHHNLKSIKTDCLGEGQKRKLNILELGSGTGMLGLYMAALGCNVILSDLEKVSTTVLQANLSDEINVNLLKENDGTAKIMALDWT